MRDSLDPSHVSRTAHLTVATPHPASLLQPRPGGLRPADHPTPPRKIRAAGTPARRRSRGPDAPLRSGGRARGALIPHNSGSQVLGSQFSPAAFSKAPEFLRHVAIRYPLSAVCAGSGQRRAI